MPPTRSARSSAPSLAGFILIEMLGLTGALWVGAGCSAVAGLVALALDSGARMPTSQAPSRAPSRPPSREPIAAVGREPADRPSTARPTLALTVAFISGSDLARLPGALDAAPGVGDRQHDVRVHDDPRRSFLIGLAIGALLFNLLRPRIGDPVRLLAVSQILVAALVMVGLVGVAVAPEALSPGTSARDAAVALAGAAILVVLPVTIVARPELPGVVGAAGRRRPTRRRANPAVAGRGQHGRRDRRQRARSRSS